jgi:pentatricopeptide repeat protein
MRLFSPRLSSVSPIYLSASEKETSRPIHAVIASFLDAGNIEEAATELRHQQSLGFDVTSSFHAVIEACCSGGGKDIKYNKEQRKSRHASDENLKLASTLLNSMSKATPHAYDILISGYARRGLWEDASELLTEMETKLGSSDDTHHTGSEKDNSPDILPALNTYQTVLSSLANNGQYDKMMSLLTMMRRRGVKPTVYTFNTLMNICAQDKPSRWKEALSLLSQCQREPGVNPDLVTYTTAMR